jgi:predicted nucleic acid-binding protein
MNDIVVFDTSVLIDNQRTARHSQRMADCPERIRNSSVVLAELWRGATVAGERQFVRGIEKSRPILTPTENNWLESGQILARIRDDLGFGAEKLRDLHFDVLIALTVRTHGARLITSNRADFELIRKYRDFKLEVW